MICAPPLARSARLLAAQYRRSGRANIVRLSRQSHAVLVPDSADDHETQHAYSLPGIVIYVRNALLSARPASLWHARREAAG
jgi:hypothetical protein